MKFYNKNKNFIPNSFYMESKENNKKRENKIIKLFVIINLIIIPFNLKNINILIKKDVKIQQQKSYKYDSIESFKLDSIILVAEEVFSDDYEEVYIENNAGEILLNNLDDISNISNNNIISPNQAVLINDEKYKIGVVVNE